ncbi:hypothetical protein PSTT_16818 [Puccinia striiformis]|uniref:Uncharacterized protein n=1 Tax=Puccinia striiformis TaxID=27350 RepID=A0A2S4UBC4_9BASI|nr:hypothetical protein PSTT_16818 [Puccinia striiformis]
MTPRTTELDPSYSNHVRHKQCDWDRIRRMFQLTSKTYTTCLLILLLATLVIGQERNITIPTSTGSSATSYTNHTFKHYHPVKLTPIPDATGAAGSVPVPGATGGKPNGRYGPDDQYIASGVVKTIVPILSTFVLMSLTVILTTRIEKISYLFN